MSTCVRCAVDGNKFEAAAIPDVNRPPITVVGSGLAGTLLTCILARAGHRVDLYEKRADPRRADVERGRSINLALSVRGLHALREVGLADDVLKTAIPMQGRVIHALDGRLAFQPYGKDEREVLYSVSRADLNRLLVEAAARLEGVRLFFRHRCVGFDLDTGIAEFSAEGIDAPVEVPTTLLVGADGVFSAIRGQLQKREGFDYSQEYLGHGYKELSIPAGPGGAFRLEKHALHIWPRGDSMMIALPNQDGSFTCTLFWPLDGPNSFAALTDEATIGAYFRRNFADAVPLMPTLARDFRHNPTGPLVTIRCRPWHLNGRAVLLGDACHAVVPFLGQGMNAAFEDCTVLRDCLAQHGPDYGQAFRRYQELRKENLDALADLCVENFIEMRDRVASPWFVLAKRLQVFLHRLLPGWYVPLYVMIEFTRIPYAEARRRARRQNRLILGLLSVFFLIVFVAVLIYRG